MAIINPNLFGEATGRLPKEPKIFENKDGSKSVRFTVMVRNNFKSKDGEYASQGIDFEDFVPATTNGNGVYGILKTGTLVKVMFEPRVNNWTDKDGNKHYDQVLRATDVRILEGKSVTDARAGAGDVAGDEESVENDSVSIDELI